MEVLCRLSYSGAEPMIATGPGRNAWEDSLVRRFLPLFTAIVAGTLTACAGHDVPLARPSGLSFARIAFGHRGTLKVRIADDPTERAHGLMGVARLPSDEGMAFLFPQPTNGRFW